MSNVNLTIAIVILTFALSSCALTKPISLSPSQDYAVSVQSSLFDTLRIDSNETSLFSDGKFIGFIRVEPVPKAISSVPDFLSKLRSNSESETVETNSLNFSSGFKGFSAKYRNYLTGYLVNDEQPDSILIFSFPEEEFDKIAGSISPGI
ncbi:MAG: hypothetical protein GYB26_14495 [Gammaproteobacteria bacterium]|nr:hypothetical protein [Gammaproteobacteria bacterium]